MTTAVNRAFKESAIKIKRTLLDMKKAAKAAGMEKAYGVNGPLGQLAIDAIFPGAPDDIFEGLMSKDPRAVNIRKTYKRTMGKQVGDSLISQRMANMNDYLGFTDSHETFLKIANAAKDVKKGKGDVVEFIVNKAQDKEELKSRIAKGKAEDKVTGVESDIAQTKNMNPTSETTTAMAQSIQSAGVRGMEQLAQAKEQV